MEFETTDVAKLQTLSLALSNYIAHALPNGKLYKATIQSLVDFTAPYISALGASSYVNITDTVLPDPSGENSYSIVGSGTYTQTGESNLVLSGDLNIIFWNGTTWTLTKAITINLNGYLQIINDTEPVTTLITDGMLIKGAAIFPDGSIGTTSPTFDNWAITEEITARPGDEIKFYNYNEDNTPRIRFNYVDSSFSAFDPGSPGEQVVTVMMPENSVSFQILVVSADPLFLLRGAKIEKFAVVDTQGLLDKIEELRTEVKNDTILKPNRRYYVIQDSDLIKGAAIFPDGSITFDAAYANWAITKPLMADPGQKYTFVNGAVDYGNTIRVRINDYYGNVLSVLEGGGAPGFSFVFPKDSHSYQVQVVSLDSDFKLNNAQIRLFEQNELAGKKILFFGDSLTADRTYFINTVIERLGLIPFINGIAGSCVSGGTGNAEGDGTYRTPLVDRAAPIGIAGVDAIFIFAGTNDWHYHNINPIYAPLGDFDSTDRNTFFGAYKEMLDTLIANNPTTRIITSTMHVRGFNRAYYAQQKGYADATIQVSNSRGCYCLNFFGESGFTYENASTLIPDTVHFTTPTSKLMAANHFSETLYNKF